MLTSASSGGCAQCSGRIIDAGEEFVCSSCGVVTEKEVLEGYEGKRVQAVDYTNHSLGSFLGPLEYTNDEKVWEGLSGSSSTFRYLKTISDFSYREGARLYACVKLIERVCEKLSLPRAVTREAVIIAKEMLEASKAKSGFTLAAISAFSVSGACKISGTTRVGLKEVIQVHKDLGYRLKASSIIQVSIEAPLRIGPRSAEDYLGRVLTRLPQVLVTSGGLRAGYLSALGEMSKVALECVDGPSRGGHNPRSLAATALYAAETALASVEGRKKVFSQRDVAICAGSAEYTIREQFVEIFKPRMDSVCALVRSRLSGPRTRTILTVRTPPHSSVLS